MSSTPVAPSAESSTIENDSPNGRPPHAVVGSHKVDEEMFGRVFDPQIVRRIWHFVKPYHRQVVLSVMAVLAFTATQLAIPLIIRHTIDNGLNSSTDGRSALFYRWCFLSLSSSLISVPATYRKILSVEPPSKCCLIFVKRCSPIFNPCLCLLWIKPRPGV